MRRFMLLLGVCGAVACEPEKEDNDRLAIELYSAAPQEGREDALDALADEIEMMLVRRARPGEDPRYVVFKLSENSGSLKQLAADEPYQLFVRGFVSGEGEEANVPRFFGGSREFRVDADETTRVSVQVGEADCFSLNRGASQTHVNTGAEDLLKARMGYTMTPLDDGTVLLIGGGQVNGDGEPTEFYDAVEIYDPNRGQFLPASGGAHLEVPRLYHTATPIGGGSVLVFGGLTAADGRRTVVRTVEIVTVTSSGVSVRPLQQTLDAGDERYQHQATALFDDAGSVLITGGRGPDGALLRRTLRFFPSETSDPSLGRFEPQGDLCVARALHTTTGLQKAAELAVVGGGIGVDAMEQDAVLSHMEVFTVNERQPGCCGGGMANAQRGCFVTPMSTVLAQPRFGHRAMLVDGGRQVLFAGGFSSLDRAMFSTGLEAMDESFKMRAPEDVGVLANGRGDMAATLLLDESILLTGGRRGNEPVADTTRLVPERTDPRDLDSPITGYKERALADGCGISEPRYAHGAVTMGTGAVLVAGGVSGQPGNLKATLRAELYFPRVLNVCVFVPDTPACLRQQ